MNLNCGCVIKYFVLLYFGMCSVLNKICRFKCGNNTKTETTLKKQHIRPRFIPEPRQKRDIWSRVLPKSKPKSDIWPRVLPKPKPKSDIWPWVILKPRPKREQIF